MGLLVTQELKNCLQNPFMCCFVVLALFYSFKIGEVCQRSMELFFPIELHDDLILRMGTVSQANRKICTKSSLKGYNPRDVIFLP